MLAGADRMLLLLLLPLLKCGRHKPTHRPSVRSIAALGNRVTIVTRENAFYSCQLTGWSDLLYLPSALAGRVHLVLIRHNSRRQSASPPRGFATSATTAAATAVTAAAAG